MNIYDLATPRVLLDLEKAEENIDYMINLCKENNKEIYPMVNTNKSSELTKMMVEKGVHGLLLGSIKEAEVISEFIDKGIIEKNFPVIYAYPMANKVNLKRVLNTTKKLRLILSIDGIENATILNEVLEELNQKSEVIITINCGFNRFGVLPGDAITLAQNIKDLKNLEIVGIRTYPGQVYSADKYDDIEEFSINELVALKIAKRDLEENGYKLKFVMGGSTATIKDSVLNEDINILSPGNFIFRDNTQIKLGVSDVENCSLNILSTISSHPDSETFIIDSGSKSFGLDKIEQELLELNGVGHIVGHNELKIVNISEEISKVRIEGKTNLKVGDKIRIIPEHASSIINMEKFLIGIKDDEVVKDINIDMR